MEEYFSSSTWGKSDIISYCMDGGNRTRDPQKTQGLSTTPFGKVISGVLVRLTTCKRLTESLPYISGSGSSGSLSSIPTV